MSVSLKDDIALALRSHGNGSKLKIETLEKMVHAVQRNGSLGKLYSFIASNFVTLKINEL